jgi:hypothetical protein
VENKQLRGDADFLNFRQLRHLPGELLITTLLVLKLLSMKVTGFFNSTKYSETPRSLTLQA